MVFQSNFTQHIIDYLSSESYSVDFGDSVSVNYEDNTLDNVYFSKSTDIEIVSQTPMIKYSFTMEDTEGNGYTYNALMLKLGTTEMNKILFNDLDKDTDVALEVTFNLVFYPN